MKKFSYNEPELFDAFIKSTQYIVRLTTQQDVWEHVGKFLAAHFPAAWTAYVRRDNAGKIYPHYCTQDDAFVKTYLLGNDVGSLVAEVLDTGFLASRCINAPQPSMTVFLPITGESGQEGAMLIGHAIAEPLPNNLLNIYLAVTGLAGAAFDRLRKERELRDHHDRLEELVGERTAELENARKYTELILHAVGEGICGTDKEGRITFVNRSAARLLGRPPGDLIGSPAHGTFHHMRPDGTPYAKEECIAHSTLKNGTPHYSESETFFRKDGTAFPVEYMTTPVIEKDAVVGAVVVFRDITERLRSQEALRKSVRRLELLGHTAGELLQTREPQKLVESLCREVMALLDCHAFFNFLADEAAGKLHLNACAGISDEEAKNIEWLDYGVAVCGCAARDACRIVAEHIPGTPDPRTEIVKSYGIRAYACHPLLDTGNKVLGTLSFGTRSRETFTNEDLSLMKAIADQVSTAMVRMRDEKALRDSAQELARSNADLEQFAYVASHDLQEPLRAVAGFLGLLKMEAGKSLNKEAGEFIQFSIEGAERMQRLIRDLLAYSRVGTKGAAFRPISMQTALDAALSNLRVSIEESNASITADPLPDIVADSTQMAQLLQNLIGNGLKFHGPQRPEIHVTCKWTDGKWVFGVRDNGIGIDPQYAQRIFTIFQRLHTNEEYSGTGIGLAICKKIVERRGGRIWVESQPGSGSTFYFTVPIGGAGL